MFKKISIIGGGGTVGSSTAFCLSGKDICDEIVIYDVADKLARHHVYDINCSICKTSSTKVVAAETESDIAGSEVVVVGSSLPMGDGGAYRCSDELLFALAGLGKILRDYAQDAVVITLTNPADVVNTLLWMTSGKPAKQFLGFSINDSVRLDMAVAAYTGVSPQKITSYCVGEHGFTKAPVLSSVMVDGVERSFTDAEAEIIQKDSADRWADFLKLGINRTAGWSTGVYAATCIETIAGVLKEPLECSVILDGEYGYKGMSLGTPVYLCREGVEKIVEMELNEREKGLLQKSYEFVQSRIDELVDRGKEIGLIE